MFIATLYLPRGWSKFSDLITVDPTAAYLVQNTGDSLMFVRETDTTPLNSDSGFIVKPTEFIRYKGATELYLKGVTAIAVQTEEE
jgi:hypothetical protein